MGWKKSNLRLFLSPLPYTFAGSEKKKHFSSHHSRFKLISPFVFHVSDYSTFFRLHRKFFSFFPTFLLFFTSFSLLYYKTNYLLHGTFVIFKGLFFRRCFFIFFHSVLLSPRILSFFPSHPYSMQCTSYYAYNETYLC